ncbi:MAG TPA: FAD-dependent oxidoreductase [Solirubrobacteraceae bacterium]|jgi:sulfide:quinone oxidoreductase
MTQEAAHPDKFRVVVVGGGVAAVECILALHDLAAERVAITVLAPNDQFVNRPMTVREPFAYSAAERYTLASIVADAGAELVADKLGWVAPDEQLVHTKNGTELPYDALVLAIGANPYPRYKHAVTVDDRRMDEALQGLIRDVDEGYLKRVAFVAPGRMAWPLPLYELALMTAGRAYAMNVPFAATIVTPEQEPLAAFGGEVSDGVAALLEEKGIRIITSAYAEVPAPGEVVINPGDRLLRAQRVIALPELYGPAVRGLHVGEHGFIPIDRFCRVPHAGPVYAAGDAVDFPIKHGGVGCQQADVVAESIAKLAGSNVEPKPFNPVIQGVLLTDERPRYIAASIAGGQGCRSRFSDSPIDGATTKVAGKYLTPYLARVDSGVTV